MSMNSCPPELHSYICQLSCTDDGRTVRALGLVSKYFREISRPFLYHSVAISSLAKIPLLIEKLEATPIHLRHIRHLFISDQETSTPTSGAKPTNRPNVAGLNYIFSFAASTVETLTFISSSPLSTPIIGRLFRTPLPRLRDLTISGFYPFPSSKTMPSLERLHLHGNRNPHGLLQAGGLDDACPSLTHLRVSGLSMAVSFALELQEAFSDDYTSLFPSTIPPRVQHVVIQPAPALPVSGKPAATHAREELMMDKLRAVKSPKGVRLSILERSEMGAFYASLKSNWVSRLEGGEGCWSS